MEKRGAAHTTARVSVLKGGFWYQSLDRAQPGLHAEASKALPPMAPGPRPETGCEGHLDGVEVWIAQQFQYTITPAIVHPCY